MWHIHLKFPLISPSIPKFHNPSPTFFPIFPFPLITNPTNYFLNSKPLLFPLLPLSPIDPSITIIINSFTFLYSPLHLPLISLIITLYIDTLAMIIILQPLSHIDIALGGLVDSGTCTTSLYYIVFALIRLFIIILVLNYTR